MKLIKHNDGCESEQVDWWMDPCKDPITSDFCVPGWAAKAVTRVDQAYFEQASVPIDVVFYKTGDNQNALGSIYLPDKVLDQESHEKVCSFVSEKPHVRITLQINILRPVSDIDSKLEKDVQNQKAGVEKTVRSMITNAQKAAARASAKAKAKPKSISKGRKADVQPSNKPLADPLLELFATLGVQAPEAPEDRQKLVEQLLEREGQLESIVEKARDAIVKPDKISITKMVGQDEKQTKGARARIMQEALMNAQKAANGDTEKDKEKDKDETVVPRLGPQALAASVKGSKLFKGRSAGKKTDQSLAQVIALGKHLLKWWFCSEPSIWKMEIERDDENKIRIVCLFELLFVNL